MSSGLPLDPSLRTHTFALADLNDVDGVVQGIATSTSASVIQGSGLDGAVLNTAKAFRVTPRTVTVTTSAQAGAYNTTDPITVAGVRGGKTITEDLTLTAANGGETIRGLKAFDIITSIDVPAQVLTTGQLEFGVGDLCNQPGSVLCRRIRPQAAGFLRLRFDEAGEHDDSLPAVANQLEEVAPQRVLSDPGLTSPTDVGLTLYL